MAHGSWLGNSTDWNARFSNLRIVAMRIQDLPPPSRFVFWCTAPFFVATLVLLPFLVSPPAAIGWIVLIAFELFAACAFLGLYDPVRFKLCWRAAGAIVFAGYLAYLVDMVMKGQWLGNGRRAETTVLNALLGLFLFGYPGFMYAVFGRFTWRHKADEPFLIDGDSAGSDWGRLWDARLVALEIEFGKSEEQIATSPVPIYLGGGADVLMFKNHIDGIVYVTAGLIGDGDQQQTDIGEYELMMCARNENDWMPPLLSRLAPYTFEATLNTGDTLDIASAMPAVSTIAALLCSTYRQFKVGDIAAGVLLCIGITDKELEHCHINGHSEVLARLKAGGVYPYTMSVRDSVV